MNISFSKIDEAGKEESRFVSPAEKVRLFATPSLLTSLSSAEIQIIFLQPVYRAFIPVPNLSLPEIDDCPEFNADVCNYMYHFQVRN